MVKTKAINPHLIADISAYACILPISTFFLLRRNFKNRLKWVCVLLLLSNFFFDLVSTHYAKTPAAIGTISRFEINGQRQLLHIQVEEGDVHEGQYFSSAKYAGIINQITHFDNEREKVLEMEGNSFVPQIGVQFKVYSNLWVVNIALLMEVIFALVIFLFVFESKIFWKRFTGLVLICSIIWWILRNLILDKLYIYDGILNTTTTLFILLFALAYFYHQLTKTENPFIYASSAFWIISGILLYKSATFFLFIYENALHLTDKANFFVINSVAYIILCLLLTISFIHEKKMSKG